MSSSPQRTSYSLPPPLPLPPLTPNSKAQKIWKIFGRDTHAGRVLHQVYKLPQAPKIDYPKVKTNPNPKPLGGTNLIKKNCPQKTKIDYPSPIKKEEKKISKVDLIPKRKNEKVIREEIEKMKENVERPVNKGVDRERLISELQVKFKNGRGALPKKAQLPLSEPIESEVNEEEIKQNAKKKLNGKLNFLKEKKEEKIPNKAYEGNELKAELQQMFDSIVEEMEERQNFLETLKDLDESELKERIKKEIVERVSELQKINGMLREIK